MRSGYLIGADGARSAVREAIGSTMTGEGAFSRNFSIIFRAPDLAARQVHGPAIMYWMLNEEVPSVLGPMDEEGLWMFMVDQASRRRGSGGDRRRGAHPARHRPERSAHRDGRALMSGSRIASSQTIMREGEYFSPATLVISIRRLAASA